jgi:hypothetical protein
LITGSSVPQLEGSDVSSAGSTLETENAVHERSERHPVPQMGWEVEKEGRARPRTLGELVKTLNCADSKKERVEDMDLISWEQLVRKESNNKASTRSRFQQKEEEERLQEFRPVLITVQDSPVAAMSPTIHQIRVSRSRPLWQQPRKTSVQDPSTRITIGLDEPKPLSNVQQRSTVSRKRSGPKQNVREDQKQVSRPSAVKKSPAPKISPADAARASKWRTGLQHRWKPQDGYDDAESTVASRSVMTGLSGDTSEYTGYTTDFTDEVTEDERYNARNRQRKMSHRAPSRTRRGEQANKSMLAGVAEDLGVVAGMLFMDVTACGTCVAETTKESVTSCGPEPGRK